MDQALGRQLEPLNKQPEALHAGHHGVHLLSDPPAEVGQQLELGQITFGRFGAILALGAVFSQNDHLAEVADGLAAGDNRLQQPVNGQVGIAADRRGEMAVALAGQRVVLLFFRTVDRPLHRAQHCIVDGALLWAAGYPIQKLLQLEAAFQALGLEAQIGDELSEGFEFPRCGGLVDAAEEEQSAAVEHLGHRLVGPQHELFDDLMADGVLSHVGAGHPTAAVKLNLDLGHTQFQGPALPPPAAEDHGQLVHPPQQTVDLKSQFAPPGVGILQELVDLLVGEPPAALDGRGVCLGGHRKTVVGQLDKDRLGVADLSRLEAGQAVRDDLGQHGHHAVGQIDAGGPVQRLAVQGGFPRDEVRHVGDVYPQPPMPTVAPFQRDGVVEIPRVGRIDGNDRLAGQIKPVRGDRLVESLGLFPGLLKSVLGEPFRQVELADDGKCIDAGLVAGAEHFGYYPFSFTEVGGETDHLEDDLVLGACTLCPGVADAYG